MGLADGASEVSCVDYNSDDNDEDKAGYGQPEITLLHSSSLESSKYISIRARCDALFVHAGQVRRSLHCAVCQAQVNVFRPSILAAMACCPFPLLCHRPASRTPGAV